MEKQGALKSAFDLLSPEKARETLAGLTPEQQGVMESIARAYDAALADFGAAEKAGATPDFSALFQKQMKQAAKLDDNAVEKLAADAAKLKDAVDAAPEKGVDEVFSKLEGAGAGAAPAAANQNAPPAATTPPAPPAPPAPPPKPQKLSRREWLKTAGAGGLLALAWIAAGASAYKVAEQTGLLVEETSKKVETKYPQVSGPTAVDVIDGATMAYFMADMAMLSTGRISGIRPVDFAAMAGFLGARCVFGGPEAMRETTHILGHAAKEASAILVFATAVEGMNVDLAAALRDMPGYKDDMAVQLAANFTAASLISPFFSTITTTAALKDELEKIFFSAGKMNRLLASIAIEHHANMSGATGIDGDPPTFHNIGTFGLNGAVALQALYGMPLAAYSLVSGLYKANLAVLMGPETSLDTFKNPAKWLTFNATLRQEAWDNTRRGLAAVAPYMPAFLGHSLINLARYAINPLTGFNLQQDNRGLQVFLGERLKEAAVNTFNVLAHADPQTKHRFTPAAHLTSELLGRMGGGMTEMRKLQLDPFAARLEGLLREANEETANKLNAAAPSMALLNQALNERDPARRKAAYAALTARANADFGADKGGSILQVAASLNAFEDTLDRASKQPLLLQSNPLAVARRLTEQRLSLAAGPAIFETAKTIGFQTMALPALGNTIAMMIKAMRSAHLPETVMRTALLMAEWKVSQDADNWACHTGVSQGAAKEGLAMYGSSTNMSINGGAKKEDGNPGPTKKIIAASRGEESRADVAKGSLVHADTTAVSLAYSLALDAVGAEEKLMKAIGIEHPALKNRPAEENATSPGKTPQKPSASAAAPKAVPPR